MYGNDKYASIIIKSKLYCLHALVLYHHVSFFTVTIARAIELKHNATLIAALAFETANFYQKAGRFFVFFFGNENACRF